ncbi:MAG: serine hydrolase [Saprospiraceae bacterium]|nr:serine hydrolase [Saprospiraceae bacterium]
MITRLLLFSLLIFISCHQNDGSQLTSSNQRMEDLIQPLVNTNNYSGTIAVSNRNELLYTGSYGLMNHEYQLENHNETRFFIASASMMFTSVAIMKLVDQGLVQLNDPLSKFFPGYSKGDKITIHQMLAQRSGIPRIGNDDDVNYDLITKISHTSDELLAYIWEKDLLFEPGDQYAHERSDYIFLAGIIEQVAGVPFGEYLKEEIFIPLGMEHTGHYNDQSEIITDLSKGYAPDGLYGIASAPFLDWSSKTGHASIYSTAEDFVKWGRAALNRDLLSDESWGLIFKDHGDGVGYGWFISPHDGHERYQMNGRSPGYSSYFAIYPEEDLIVSMLSNIYVSLPRITGPLIASIYFDEAYEPIDIVNEQLSEEQVEEVLGFYQFGEDFYAPNGSDSIYLENGGLYGNWGGLIPVKEGDEVYRKFIYRTFWSDIEFIVKEPGDEVQMIFDGYLGVKRNQEE